MSNVDPYKAPEEDGGESVLSDEAVKFWIPQATSMAERGKSLILITQFLRSKGVNQSIAQVAADEIMNRGAKREFRRKLPVLIAGYFFIGAGVLLFLIYSLISGGFSPGGALIGLLPGVLGCALLWGGYLQGTRG